MSQFVLIWKNYKTWYELWSIMLQNYSKYNTRSIFAFLKIILIEKNASYQ